MTAEESFELAASSFFCANTACPLHVALDDPYGGGNWAVLEGGMVVGRSRYDGKLLCDRCGRELLGRSTPSILHSTVDCSETREDPTTRPSRTPAGSP